MQYRNTVIRVKNISGITNFCLLYLRSSEHMFEFLDQQQKKLKQKGDLKLKLKKSHHIFKLKK